MFFDVITLAWFIVPTVILWAVLPCVIGWYSASKGNGFASGFWWSLLLSPLVGGLIAALRQPNHSALEARALESGDFKKCSACAELVRRQATRCRYCGEPAYSSEVQEDKDSKSGDGHKVVASTSDDEHHPVRVGRTVAIILVIFAGILMLVHLQPRRQPAPGTSEPELKPYITGLPPDPATSATPPNARTTPHLLRLDNGIEFPFGELLEDFKGSHTDIDCTDLGVETVCEARAFSASDCPSFESCKHVTFVFRDGRLYGFMADYNQDTWKEIFSASQKAFQSEGKEATRRMGPVTMRVVWWDFADGTALSFVHSTGTDIYGHPIKEPFSVHYGAPIERR